MHVATEIGSCFRIAMRDDDQGWASTLFGFDGFAKYHDSISQTPSQPLKPFTLRDARMTFSSFLSNHSHQELAQSLYSSILVLDFFLIDYYVHCVNEGNVVLTLRDRLRARILSIFNRMVTLVDHQQHCLDGRYLS